MELNWTTVVLEMVNFLVLVWILKRFLYRPVLAVIEERRASVEATLTEARQRQEEAAKLQAQYENRIAEWQREKEAARESFQREIQQQRGQALEALDATLASTRERARVLEERRWREFEEGAERKGLELGARFASQLLEGLAGPEVEDRILALLAQDLVRLSEEQRSALRRAAAAAEDGVRVEMAHPLTSEQRDSVAHAVQNLLGTEARCRFEETPELIAGLRLSLGDWSLGLNLRDELRGFVDTARVID